MIAGGLLLAAIACATVGAQGSQGTPRAQGALADEAGAAAQTADLAVGYSEYDYSDGPTGKTLRIYCYAPSGRSPSSPVLFAMHGDNRTAFAYRMEWKAEAERRGFMLLVPCFDEASFPGANGYQFGNVVAGGGKTAPSTADNARGTAGSGSAPGEIAMNHPETWLFSMMDRIFEDFKARWRCEREGYAIYGHSAGAQFVHRMIMFRPDSRAEFAIAANAGWYLEPDRGIIWPFGLGGAGEAVTDEGLDGFLGFPLVLLLGDADVLDNFQFNKSTEAMRQGQTRFERGCGYFELCRSLAQRRGTAFGWRRVVVPGVGHSNREMAAKAAELVWDFYAGK